MPDFGNEHVRRQSLNDLVESDPSLFHGYTLSKNGRYLYFEDKSRSISIGLALNKAHIRTTFELKPAHFHRAKSILQKLKTSIPNEPGIAQWRQYDPAENKQTLAYQRDLYGGETWAELKPWLIEKMHQLEQFRRSFE